MIWELYFSCLPSSVTLSSRDLVKEMETDTPLSKVDEVFNMVKGRIVLPISKVTLSATIAAFKIPYRSTSIQALDHYRDFVRDEIMKEVFKST